MKKTICLTMSLIGTGALADVPIDAYPLGTSSSEITQALIKDGFYITELSDKSISARKLAVGLNAFYNEREPNKAIAEFPQFNVSTEVALKFCEKKLYRLDLKSYYDKGGYEALFLARKAAYKYLDDAKAVLTDIRVSQTPKDPNVGFQYKIDRSGLGGAVKGEESVTLGLLLPTKPEERRGLSMRYLLENKWFCPE